MFVDILACCVALGGQLFAVLAAFVMHQLLA